MDRSKGIGGSDLAAIVGLNRYKDKYALWLEKTGRVEPQPDNPKMSWGRRLEATVLDAMAEELGEEYTLTGEVVAPTRSWQVVHPDAVIDHDRVVLEAKTAGERQAHRWGDEGSDDIPPEYIAQVAWYMSALDFDKSVVGVLIGGSDFRTYRIERDLTLEAFLLEQAEAFWFKNVKADVPPPVTASETVDRYIKQKFPRDTAEIRQATGQECLLMAGYAAARKDFEESEALKEKYEAELKLAIGDAAGLEFEGGRITWRRAKDSLKTDWEAIAMTLSPHKELIARYSEVRPGSRRFLPKFNQ